MPKYSGAIKPKKPGTSIPPAARPGASAPPGFNPGAPSLPNKPKPPATKRPGRRG